MNFSNLTYYNITGFAESLNLLTDNLFWVLILIAIFLVLFIILNKYETIKALITSSFFNFYFKYIIVFFRINQ